MKKQHDSGHVNFSEVICGGPSRQTTLRSRRFWTGIGTAAAVFLVAAGCNLYLVVYDAPNFTANKWWFFGMYCLAAGTAMGYITAKTYRDIVFAKLGVRKADS
jgi:hypothetical protein